MGFLGTREWKLLGFLEAGCAAVTVSSLLSVDPSKAQIRLFHCEAVRPRLREGGAAGTQEQGHPEGPV